MKEFIDKYQKAIIGTGAVSVLLICYYQQKELKDLRTQVGVQTSSVAPLAGDIRLTHIMDSLERESDSLNSEIFILQTEIGRHELSRDVIFTKYPKVGSEYSKYYNEETE
jgi:hypothetical protein